MQVQVVAGGGAVNTIPRPLYPQERVPVPFVVEAGCASGTILKDMEKKSALTGFRASNSPVRGESLHQQLYPCLL